MSRPFWLREDDLNEFYDGYSRKYKCTCSSNPSVWQYGPCDYCSGDTPCEGGCGYNANDCICEDLEDDSDE